MSCSSPGATHHAACDCRESDWARRLAEAERERDRFRERLDQFEAYAITVNSALQERERLAAAEECLREIADVNPLTDICVAEECRDFPKLRRSEWCPRCIARAFLAGGKTK